MAKGALLDVDHTIASYMKKFKETKEAFRLKSAVYSGIVTMRVADRVDSTGKDMNTDIS